MPPTLTIKVKPLASERNSPYRRTKIGVDPNFRTSIQDILTKVKEDGDQAIIEYTKQFDRVDLSKKGIRVKQIDISDAYQSVSREQVSALRYLKKRIEKIEGKKLSQLPFTIKENGLTISHTIKPIQSVGCYVPGGRAAYPSTLLMAVTPAIVAGVPRIVVCTPPTSNGDINPLVLVAADICGVIEIYRVGGAQAIAALTYGTKSIKPVLKIVGPGNRYVTLAKTLVSDYVAVDHPYGPSELVVLADEDADPHFIALDIISQAEHAPDNVGGLITTSGDLAIEVRRILAQQIKNIDRSDIVIRSLNENGFLLVCKEIAEAIDFINAFAPEHLEIQAQNASKIAAQINSAGVILIGPFTPASASDYCFGTNHILPTGGYCQMFSSISVSDFVKRVHMVECSKASLHKMKSVGKILSESEGLPNHNKALTERF